MTCKEMNILQKSNIHRNIKITSNRVITPITFRGGRITKKDTANSLIIKFSPKRAAVLNKTSAAKYTR